LARDGLPVSLVGSSRSNVKIPETFAAKSLRSQ
jgi:hypothetical protein